MLTGISAGVLWALGTVVLGIALAMSPFISTEQAVLLAPFVSTFLHDGISAGVLWIYQAVRGRLTEVFAVFKSKCFKWLLLSSAVGGPIGMTGYVLALRYMGASVGAVASAIYPAVGTALACWFLKEKVRWYQWLFLLCALLGVYGLSYAPAVAVENFWLGLTGTVMCALGWGVEAVILAKCLRDETLQEDVALTLRQTVSAVIYGTVLLPLMDGWSLSAEVLHEGKALLTLSIAALCSTLSYLLYYRTIAKVGAAKAMALNITYTAWAIVFTVLLTGDTSAASPWTLICAAVVVLCGICAAADVKQLFKKGSDPFLK